MTFSYKALPFHPAADIFPLMEGDAFDALVADIKNFGLRQPIALLGEEILDGRNRYRAAQVAGYKLNAANDFKKLPAVDPASYVISANIHRRHLGAQQRRDLLVKLVAAQPGKSDREIAREAKVDHHQVTRARKKGEATGTIVPVEKRVGADGKARTAKKNTNISNKNKATDKARPAKKQARVKEATGQAESAKPDIIKPDIIKEAEAKPDAELVLLREFAGYVLDHTMSVANPKDQAGFIALCRRVKALWGITS